jgi:DNA polymerase III subunit gamma/tau
MGQALYRKHRPKGLSEVVGQEHITDTLSNALKKGAISHAYLFTGPRGVGKTSIARILAHEVNGLPYEDDATHLDIIEIDAASNRRIDEIREIRERVHSAPTSAKYKVYIIDEVHMLTREAFNALLKTLEEPPAHVIFILATTESHKLPETIVSRTQRYTFKPIDEKKVIAHLRNIAKQEKLVVDDEALRAIARHGEGSFRDSISLLDQLASNGKAITINEVQELLGIAPVEAIDQLIDVMQSGNTADAVKLLSQLRENGYHAAQLAKQTAARLRHALIEGQALLEPKLLTHTLQQLLDVPAAHDPDALLELTILGIVMKRPDSVTTMPVKAPAKSESKVVTKAPSKPKKEDVPAPAEEPETPEPIADAPEPVTQVTSSTPTDLNDELWQDVLAVIKKRHNTLYSIARMAVPIFTDDKITLCFKFPFHQKRLSESKNSQLIMDIIEQVTGKRVSLDCVLDPSVSGTLTAAKPAKKPASKPKDDALDTISNIFGGAEVLE